ncbi:MAG: peptidyl-prolyl cis-trans isomerase A [Acidobacteria bacterium 21-70-11]|nr:MAG: peptidyl-prolyl cis-trans isomerase A [Acidobacteria bacterium 21-70-11]OYW05749.1 MAG: peptidyl-prolyl cis-trans isomerase A [Acidobacteria bacterium 37-71-11]HQT94082.1 peptidylprolyl isomerase [Thermoanaerobaculaceae bacterium]HQU33697.1 peptidylprolyl isomerase [Thermoanaerobaculaceae bacterium]
MIRFFMVLLVGVAMAAPVAAANPRVRFETSKGAFVIELEQAKAPITVGNFLEYVKSGYYDGTIFHRVIPGFMVQGGGFTADMQQKPAREPIVNESANGLANKRGTIAMARTADPNSASSQFFINLVDNGFLDKASARDGVGYCVFGKVVEGMPVLDAIAAVPTGNVGANQNVPLQPVVIKKASVVAAKAAAKPPAPQGSAPHQPK